MQTGYSVLVIQDDEVTSIEPFTKLSQAEERQAEIAKETGYSMNQVIEGVDEPNRVVVTRSFG